MAGTWNWLVTAAMLSGLGGSFEVVKTVETGSGTHGVALDREGRYAYITNSYAGSLSVLDISKRSVVATVPVGKRPNGVSVRP